MQTETHSNYLTMLLCLVWQQAKWFLKKKKERRIFKKIINGERGQRSMAAHNRGTSITCLWLDWLPGVRNSPEKRAAKRGVFTGCQFGGNNPALWIRVLSKDKAVYWEFISCTGNPHCTEGKKRTRCLPHLRTWEVERGRKGKRGEGDKQGRREVQSEATAERENGKRNGWTRGMEMSVAGVAARAARVHRFPSDEVDEGFTQNVSRLKPGHSVLSTEVISMSFQCETKIHRHKQFSGTSVLPVSSRKGENPRRQTSPPYSLSVCHRSFTVVTEK